MNGCAAIFFKIFSSAFFPAKLESRKKSEAWKALFITFFSFLQPVASSSNSAPRKSQLRRRRKTKEEEDEKKKEEKKEGNEVSKEEKGKGDRFYLNRKCTTF